MRQNLLRYHVLFFPLHSFSYFSMLAQGTCVVFSQFRKTAIYSDGLEHCLKHLHLTVKSKLLTEYIAQCSSFDVLLVTKLIFQEVKINGRDVILTVQRTSPNKYCFILTKRLVFQTIQSNVLCANSALMYRRLLTPV